MVSRSRTTTARTGGWSSTPTCPCRSARFADDPAGQYVPEAVGTVVSAGASIDNFHRPFGSLRLRYFGPRPLVQDNSVRSKATSLVNLDGGYQVAKNVSVTVEVFNLFDPAVSDIDYYFVSRLPGEPIDGVDDITFIPRCLAPFGSVWWSVSDRLL